VQEYKSHVEFLIIVHECQRKQTDGSERVCFDGGSDHCHGSRNSVSCESLSVRPSVRQLPDLIKKTDFHEILHEHKLDEGRSILVPF